MKKRSLFSAFWGKRSQGTRETPLMVPSALNLEAAGCAVGGRGGGRCRGGGTPWSFITVGPSRHPQRSAPGAGEEPKIPKQGLFSVLSAFRNQEEYEEQTQEGHHLQFRGQPEEPLQHLPGEEEPDHLLAGRPPGHV